MNLEQLEYIVEIAKTGSLTGAARNAHVTLPAISQALSSLEEELGLSLFSRARGQGAVPTAEGLVIIGKAAEIIHQIQEIREEAQSYTNSLSGELRIGTIPGPMHLIVDVVAQFKKDFPKVKITLVEKGPKEIMEDLTHHRIDIGLMVLFEHFSLSGSGLKFEKLLEGNIVAAVSKRSPIALCRKMTPEKLLTQTLVLYDDDYIKWYMERFIGQFGSPEILFTTNNTQAIQNAVRDGIAITIGLDYSFISQLAYPEEMTVIIPLDLPDSKPVYYGWVHPEGKYSSQIARKFVNRLKSRL
ncbi:LysR family transcriptional regulator [Paenibacillus sp. J22TS3]|uniref:LysR family transcriptional regulator n=1 Tax=Paenibacillus sp. J22TS3 TaxID=2807192 RepID=UPI001B2542B2|nr:LysR family transcriptional regulator [Paenibacillus sp. J22TS3]GIP21207.1 LysR family transcriptional regulator [Paenibacillus sp. J22TS3]